MPATTPVFGITYPCSGDTIDPAVFATFANTLDAALQSGTDTVATALNRPNVQVSATTNQSIVLATDTTLNFDTERYDNDSMGAGGLITTLNVNTTGVYLLSATAILNSGFTTLTTLSLFATVNGLEVLRYKTKNPTFSGGTKCTLAGPIDCLAGSSVQVRARWTGTGGPANIGTRSLGLSFLTGH